MSSARRSRRRQDRRRLRNADDAELASVLPVLPAPATRGFSLHAVPLQREEEFLARASRQPGQRDRRGEVGRRVTDTEKRPIDELLRPSDYEYYRPMTPRPRAGWPRRDSLQDCRKSLDKAHENLRHLVRENDRLRAALLEIKERQRWTLKVFIALFTGSWGLFAAVLKLFLPALLRGLVK